jgi:hypothetical protein
VGPSRARRGSERTGNGCSDEALVGLHDGLAGHVERGVRPGLIALVARRDDVHVEMVARRSFDDSEVC